MKYKYLLWDIDGTILDFIAAEKAAIKTLFIKYHLGECTDEMIQEYSLINKKYWEALERNEITKHEVLVNRFIEFFKLYGIDSSIAEAFNADYQLALGDTIVFCDNAFDLLKQLKEKYVLIAITNGTKRAQTKKIARAHLKEVFDYIFISEEVGVEKPNIEFFNRVIDTVGIKDVKEALVIGDSLTSDIQGGMNALMDTCWYNPKHVNNNKKLNITYTIDDLNKIKTILEN